MPSLIFATWRCMFLALKGWETSTKSFYFEQLLILGSAKIIAGRSLIKEDINLTDLLQLAFPSFPVTVVLELQFQFSEWTLHFLQKISMQLVNLHFYGPSLIAFFISKLCVTVIQGSIWRWPTFGSSNSNSRAVVLGHPIARRGGLIQHNKNATLTWQISEH